MQYRPLAIVEPPFAAALHFFAPVGQTPCVAQSLAIYCRSEARWAQAYAAGARAFKLGFTCGQRKLMQMPTIEYTLVRSAESNEFTLRAKPPCRKAWRQHYGAGFEEMTFLIKPRNLQCHALALAVVASEADLPHRYTQAACVTGRYAGFGLEYYLTETICGRG